MRIHFSRLSRDEAITNNGYTDKQVETNYCADDHILIIHYHPAMKLTQKQDNRRHADSHT